VTNFIGYFTISWACWCNHCNGRAYHPTKSGVNPVSGITVSAPRSIPMGTTLLIQGVGKRVVQDRMRKDFDRKGRLDVFFWNGDVRASHAICKQRGITKQVPVWRIE
jgi:3D (Asp-Asp-Asp) domain-containing protein